MREDKVEEENEIERERERVKKKGKGGEEEIKRREMENVLSTPVVLLAGNTSQTVLIIDFNTKSKTSVCVC